MSLGIGVIGTGFVANMHLAAIAQTPGVHLAGVADVDAQRARAAVRGVDGARWTTAYRRPAWRGPTSTAASCARRTTRTSTSAWPSRGGQAPADGKAAGDYRRRRASGWVDASASATWSLMGAHTHRFYDYGRTIKAAIDSGDIGRPVYVRLAILGGWIWPDWRAWVLDPRRSGGHVLHNGVHCWTWRRGGSDDEPRSDLRAGPQGNLRATWTFTTI